MSLSPNSESAPLLRKVVVQNGYPEFLNDSPAGEGEDSPQSDSLPSSVDNKYHLDEIIPLTHTNRTIVLCFDGTGDQFSEDVRTTFFKKRNPPADSSQNSKNSNIVQFFSMLRKDSKSEQMVYYQVRQLVWVVHDRYLTICIVRPVLERIPYRKSRLLSWPRFQRRWI